MLKSFYEIVCLGFSWGSGKGQRKTVFLKEI